MTFYFVVMGSIALIGLIILLLDRRTPRHDQKSQQRTSH